MTIGDSYAGIGPCSRAERPFGGISEQSYYCSPSGAAPPTRGYPDPKNALAFYKKAETVLTGLESGGLLTAADREVLARARGRIGSSNEIAVVKR
jgi:hypothetical protein